MGREAREGEWEARDHLEGIFGEAEKQGRERPTFRCVPAHLSLQEAMARQVDMADWQGNQCADYFAEAGGHSIKADDSVAKFREDAAATASTTPAGSNSEPTPRVPASQCMVWFARA